MPDAEHEYLHHGRVRYAETDAMGVAHHGVYPTWLEEARIRCLDELGTSYRELEAAGCFMPVVELAIRYRQSLRFDDVFAIGTRVERRSPGRLRFHSRVLAGQVIIAEATVDVACIDAAGRPRRLPGLNL